jgi:signal peptidase II
MPADASNLRAHAMRKYHFLVAAGVVLLDRVTKWLVSTRMDLHESIPLLPGLFRLTHVQNSGAAFGLFAESSSEWKTLLLVLFSMLALVVVSAMLWKNSHELTLTGMGLSLILGGAVGNLFDRLLYGHVVDFFDFYIGSYHWPAFNVADSAIVLGAMLLLVEIFFARRPAQQNAAR